MKDILAEYVFLVLSEAKSSSLSMNDIARSLTGSGSLKRERSGGAAGVRFVGTLADLKQKMKELGAQNYQNPSVEEPGGKFSISGRYKTYLFTFPPEIYPDVVPVAVVSFEEKDFLSDGKTLGYGAEHAVYAALSKISNNQMYANMENDTRLAAILSNSSEENILNFKKNCVSMRNVFMRNITSIDLSDLRIASAPPSGGNVPVDVEAIDPDGNNYDIHVKYKSDRLVGLQIPKIEKNASEEEKRIYDTLRQGHPNVVYRKIRDFFLEKNPKVDDIFGIFSNPNLKSKFYDALSKGGFYDTISDVIKSQLGFSSQTGNTSLLVNFLSPTDVKIQKMTPEQGENLQFNLRIPDDAKISKAFVVDAVFLQGKKQKIVKDVLDVEIGSKKRNRGLDVHKGDNYQKFVEELEKQ